MLVAKGVCFDMSVIFICSLSCYCIHSAFYTDKSYLSHMRALKHSRGILDFVRRRKLRRVAVFRPDHFLPPEVYTKCDYCDSTVVDMLSVRCQFWGHYASVLKLEFCSQCLDPALGLECHVGCSCFGYTICTWIQNECG